MLQSTGKQESIGRTAIQSVHIMRSIGGIHRAEHYYLVGPAKVPRSVSRLIGYENPIGSMQFDPQTKTCSKNCDPYTSSVEYAGSIGKRKSIERTSVCSHVYNRHTGLIGIKPILGSLHGINSAGLVASRNIHRR